MQLLTPNLTTLRDVIRYAASCMGKAFEQQQIYFGHGTDNALDEAVALVLGALHLPPDLHVSFFDAQLTQTECHLLDDLLYRRLQLRIPVPYLLGKAWFMGLPFKVTEQVLIPRSPIAEEIERRFSPWVEDADQVVCILDLCTGSGCIGIACAYAFPQAEVVLSDISKEALAIAEHNIQQHQLQGRVSVELSDVFANLQGQQFDLIVSNPPYVGAQEMDTLPIEFTHEPTLALEAPADGMAIVDRILQQAVQHLSAQGVLIVEVGNSAPLVDEQYPDLPLTWIHFERGGEGVFVVHQSDLAVYFG